MKFKIPYKKILKALQKTQGIIERREVKPILSSVLFRTNEDNSGIEIIGTNLEISIKESLEAEIIKSGGVVLDARKIFEIIKEMPDKEICFEKKENNWVEVTTDSIFFNIVGLDPQEFPEIEFFEKEKFLGLDEKKLKGMIEKTIFAASNDEARINLNGVFFEKIIDSQKEVLRLVATDGHRLSMIDRELEKNKNGWELIPELEKGVIFPKKGLLELKKILEEGFDSKQILFHFKQNNGIFKKENLILSIRVIDEDFPNYKQAIPKEPKNKAIINRLIFLSSLKRVSVIAEERSKAVNLIFKDDVLEIFTQNPVFGEGKEKIPITYQGENIRLGFNATYLIEALNAIDEEGIEFKIKDKNSPVIINPVDNYDYTNVIMPMELVE